MVEDAVVSEAYTTYFTSVIAFGKARIDEGDEWLASFKALVEKYSGDQAENEKQDAVMNCHHTLMIAAEIEHISGKQSKEYINA